MEILKLFIAMADIPAYKQPIRPVLEYASTCWDPLPKTLSDKLEASQRRAARAVFNISTTSRISTTGLLKKLCWEPLENWRLCRRIALFRAMPFNEVPVDINQHVKLSSSRTSSRRHNIQYQTSHHNTKAHMNSFFIDTSKRWNNLDVNDRLLCSPG